MTASHNESPGSTALTVATDWTVTLLVGLITVALGVIVLVWPSETLVVLSVLFGIQLLVFGVFRLIRAFADDVPNAGLLGFVGVIGILAGVIVIRHPYETVEVLALILGAVWIVFGAIDLIGAVADRESGQRLPSALLGILALGFGIVLVAWGGVTLTVLTWLAGLYLVLAGLVMVFFSIQARRA